MLELLQRVKHIAEQASLPGLVMGTSYKTPALRVSGKTLMRLKQDGTLVLHCSHARKQMLIETQPDLFYETDHYKGWPVVLIRFEAMRDAGLLHHLTEAWREAAPRSVVDRFDAERGRPVRAARSPRRRPSKSA